ncbi:MAG: hypothetical protein IT342_13240, partial [Candidatus Melainabacteria bacterium]|nr:hypothetical protein [Candidatus Melainabacteria bacterium]
IRENEVRAQSGLEGARPVEIVACHSTHAPGEPCDQKKNDGSNKDGEKKNVDRKGDLNRRDPEVARLVEQLKDRHVPLDQIAESVTSNDAAEVTQVPMIGRDLYDESAMEELMRKVSENRARTIDKLVSDARAAKAEAIANTSYVPMPGEPVPGMQPMGVKTGPMQAAANVVDVHAKPGKAKADAGGTGKGKSEKAEKSDRTEKAEKSDKAEKPGKSGKQSKKVLENALEKAKEKAKRPPRKIGIRSEASPPAATAPHEKSRQEEDMKELTFDDSDLDFNKAAKKIT